MRRVLLIEDDETSRWALAKILKKLGYEVTAVASFAGGLSALSDDYDVVLTDLMLPDGDGIDIVSAARAAGKRCQLIVITAVNDSKVLDAVARHRPDRILRKPIDVPQILRAMEPEPAE